MSLYLLNREGETRRLSENTDGGTVAYHVVSPDGKRVAYWYAQNDSELVLVLLGLDSPLTSRTQVVNEGTFPGVGRQEWLLWLPDSRRVLYAMAEPADGYPTSLWLASEGEDSPVQLMAVAPGASAYLTIRPRPTAGGLRSPSTTLIPKRAALRSQRPCTCWIWRTWASPF